MISSGQRGGERCFSFLNAFLGERIIFAAYLSTIQKISRKNNENIFPSISCSFKTKIVYNFYFLLKNFSLACLNVNLIIATRYKFQVVYLSTTLAAQLFQTLVADD